MKQLLSLKNKRWGLAAVLCLAALPIYAVQPSTTTLAVTAGGVATSLVTTGTVVTLTAAVQSGGTGVTKGQVNFCDASAAHCTDIHLLGTAQLTTAGKAAIKLRPGIGAKSIKAIFAGTKTVTASASSISTLDVTGGSTTTSISQSGSAGNYTLTSTVSVTGSSVAPTGTVSFLDTTNGNYALASSPLGTGTLAQTFAAEQSFASGPQPYSVTVGDFNRDGIPDLAIPNYYGSNTVSVMLGNGNGSFAAPVPYATGETPTAVFVADFNRDGFPDLVVGNGFDNKLSVLLNNGDGTFAPQINYATGQNSGRLTIGDFNGDGIPDIVCLNGFDDTASVLLGNGDGSFADQIVFPVESGSNFVVSLDINGDNDSDLIISNQSTGMVEVLLSNGDGTFGPPTDYVVGSETYSSPFTIASGDFNGDGALDLVVGTTNVNGVSVLLGNGNGTFAPQTIYPLDWTSDWVTVADLNGDGIADLVISSGSSSTVKVLPGKGDGTFLAPTAYVASDYPYSVAAGDFNGDGVPDLVVTNTQSDSVGVILNQWTATATAAATGVSPVGAGAHAVEASYPGDTFFVGSTSSTVSLNAQTVTTQLQLAVPSSSTYGQQVTLTATLSPYTTGGHSTDGEVVTFYNGGSSLGIGTLSGGVAKLVISTLSAGSYSLTASYPGDANLAANTSAPGALTVNPATATITLGSLSQIYTGSTLSATATTSPANLPVSFTYNGSAAAPTAAGSYTVVATINPGGNYTGTATGALVIGKASQSITFGSIAAQMIGGTISLSASATSHLVVSFASTTASVCSVTGTTAKMLTAGTCTIQASQPGSTNYAAASTVSVSFSVATAASFKLNATPNSETIRRGVLAAFLLEAQSQNGFSGSVKISCSGGPAVSVCGAFPQTLKLQPNKMSLALSGILFPKNTAPGTYTLTFTGTSGSTTVSTTAQFKVQN